MRTWFANNKVDKFTITVFYKRTGVHTSSQTIVSNGDCKQTRAYGIVNTGDDITASITTEQTNIQTLTGSVNVFCTNQPRKPPNKIFPNVNTE